MYTYRCFACVCLCTCVPLARQLWGAMWVLGKHRTPQKPNIPNRWAIYLSPPILSYSKSSFQNSFLNSVCVCVHVKVIEQFAGAGSPSSQVLGLKVSEPDLAASVFFSRWVNWQARQQLRAALPDNKSFWFPEPTSLQGTQHLFCPPWVHAHIHKTKLVSAHRSTWYSTSVWYYRVQKFIQSDHLFPNSHLS